MMVRMGVISSKLFNSEREERWLLPFFFLCLPLQETFPKTKMDAVKLWLWVMWEVPSPTKELISILLRALSCSTQGSAHCDLPLRSLSPLTPSSLSLNGNLYQSSHQHTINLQRTSRLQASQGGLLYFWPWSGSTQKGWNFYRIYFWH